MLLLPLLLIVFCAGSEQSRGKEPDELETMTSLFDELKDHGIADGSDIYCDFNTGSYAEYFGFHPYIDGRAEVFLKKVNGEQDLFSEYVRHGNGEIYYRDFLDRYDFACLVVNSDMEPAFYQELLHAPEIEVLFTNGEYTVFLEKGNSRSRNRYGNREKQKSILSCIPGVHTKDVCSPAFLCAARDRILSGGRIPDEDPAAAVCLTDKLPVKRTSARAGRSELYDSASRKLCRYSKNKYKYVNEL
jgi:hypothetical protein